MGRLPQKSNRDQSQFNERFALIMQDVLKIARQKGASAAAVSINHDHGFSVDVRMGEVETIAFSEDNSIGVAVYIGHQKGSASSTDTSPAALEAMVSAAIEIAHVSAADSCFGLADKSLMAFGYAELDSYHPWAISPSQAIEVALQCERQALSADTRISNSDGVHLSTHTFSHGYANSHDFMGIMKETRHNLSCSLIATEGDTMQRDYDYSTAQQAKNLTSIEVLAESAASRAVARLGARKIKTQRAPILFSSRVSSSLFSAFISAINGSNLYRKNSFLVDSIGLQLFPSFIRIYDDPYLLGGFGSTAFDDEGVATRNNVWVDSGQIQQYVLNSYTACKMGLKTSGNSGGVFNLTIDPTAGDLNHLLKKMDKGLLVTEMMGQGVNILTGDYSRGVSGFWVEGGQIQFPVEEVTIAGNLKEMFAAMVAVGSDINPNLSTRCGSVLISEMMIAGY